LVIVLLLLGLTSFAPGPGATARAQQKKRGPSGAKPKDRNLVRPPNSGPPTKTKPETGVTGKPAMKERRVALVIGNSDYRKAHLNNPVNDARLIGQTLRSLGFEVQERENLSRQEMLDAMKMFGQQISNGGVGLFYYAGHGVQMSGRNYLVPTDFGTVASLQDVETELVYAGEVLATMSAMQGLNIVILDACRNNPTDLDFPPGVSQGFAEITNTPAGTYVAFSTSPGQTASDGAGPNSPYTSALASSLRMRPSRLEDVFIHTRIELDRTTGGQQVPWENSSIKTVFFFSPDEVAAMPPPNLTVSSPRSNKLRDGLLGGLRQITFTVPVTGATGRVTSRLDGRARSYVEDLRGVGLEMMEIPGGRFLMGSNASDADDAYKDAKRYNDEVSRETVTAEMPQHNVNVPGFYMGKYEVTQGQWLAVMGRLPRIDEKYRGNDLPVVNVSWHEAEEFCNLLSQMTGRQYRLPSEAEWEYACRAGTRTPFAFGPTVNPQLSNFNGTAPFGDAPRGVYRQSATPVGQMGAANAYGLFDMHGNAWEWCADTWHESYDAAPTDGDVWEKTDEDNRVYRVIRGGSWDSIANSCRSASRRKHAASMSGTSKIGFRVVAN
jgi:formylglycine-generating enzyme required for sulfatase activity